MSAAYSISHLLQNKTLSMNRDDYFKLPRLVWPQPSKH